MHDKLIESILKEIRERHHEIIDDWCKAYLAELYESGIDIKPGCFTLYEQDIPLEESIRIGIVGKRYWFKLNRNEDEL